MNIAVLLPIFNDPAGKWAERYPKFLKGLQNLEGVYGNWCWCLNMQHVDADTYARVPLEVEDATGHQVVYAYNEYAPPVQPGMIREHAADLVDPAWPDVYLSIDDDFVFRPGINARYSEAVQAFEEDPKLGVLMCLGSLGGSGKGTEIYPRKEILWRTNRGEFLRNLKDEPWRYCEHDLFNVPGPIEDFYCACNRFARGYTGAVTYNTPVAYQCGRTDGGFLEANAKIGRYDPETDMHNPKYTKAVIEFISRKYGDPDFKYWNRRLPRSIRELSC